MQVWDATQAGGWDRSRCSLPDSLRRNPTKNHFELRDVVYFSSSPLTTLMPQPSEGGFNVCSNHTPQSPNWLGEHRAILYRGRSKSHRHGFRQHFGTIGEALGVGLFLGAAAALGGFELVKLLFNANDLVDNTKQLEGHIDTVLSQVSDTLQTVKTFVQNCDKALKRYCKPCQTTPRHFVQRIQCCGRETSLGTVAGAHSFDGAVSAI